MSKIFNENEWIDLTASICTNSIETQMVTFSIHLKKVNNRIYLINCRIEISIIPSTMWIAKTPTASWCPRNRQTIYNQRWIGIYFLFNWKPVIFIAQPYRIRMRLHYTTEFCQQFTSIVLISDSVVQRIQIAFDGFT